jgi:hypothetical protein
MVEQRKQADPASLTTVDWPLTLAHETARVLSVASASAATPVPATNPISQAPAPAPASASGPMQPRGDSSLSKGAYNHTRGMVYVSRPALPAQPPAATAPTGPTASPGNSLNKGAYDQRKAFVDTDGDGRKFDFRQPPRPR